ncbi:MAG: hypothetical protein DRN66_01900 [Candidatus Nanohalarchaeota archaeon]|nr:MAG: hypothetical protein DRN66_01900 [Candidatus Nanohaloarchaeota archaeon]
MEWYVFAFACAIVSSISAVVEKKTLIKEHAMEFSTVFSIFNFLFVLPFLPLVDFSVLKDPYALGFIYAVSVLGGIAFFFIAKGVRHMDISVVSPLLNFGPAFLLFLAWFFLGETLSLQQLAGVMIIIFGSYLLEISTKHPSLFGPVKKMIHSKHIYYIFLALILYGFSSIGDKIILGRITPVTYLVFVHFFIAVNFIVLIHLFHNGFEGIKNGIRNAGKWIAIVCVLTCTYRYLQLQAISMAYVSLVIPIKRTSTIFTTIIGGGLFHEDHLLKKIICCIIMFAGAYLIIA